MNKNEAKMNKVKFNYDTLKALLPANHLSIISSSVKKEFKVEISTRHIRYILKGERTDKYSIIEKAIELSEKEKEKMKAIKKRLQKLTK